MSVICIVLLKTVQYWAQQDCHETNYTSKLHLLDPLSFASYFNFFVDENFDLSPKNLETNPNVSPDIHLRRQREMVEKWTPAKIFCRVKNHEQRIVAMFCWLGEKFPPQSWTWRIFRNIFRSRLSPFFFEVVGTNSFALLSRIIFQLMAGLVSYKTGVYDNMQNCGVYCQPS